MELQKLEETVQIADLVEVQKKDLLQSFTDGTIDKVLHAIKDVVSQFEPDMTTDKGKKEIASLARKVASSKTFIDGLGKELVADWKAKAKVVDNERSKARNFLDALKEEVRKPLTEFEEREKARLEKHRANLSNIEELSKITPQSSKEAADILKELIMIEVDASWEEFMAAATKAKDSAVALVQSHYNALKSKEEAAAQWEALRKEQEEKERREREVLIAKQAEEKARIEAERQAQMVAIAAEQEAARKLAETEAAQKAAEDRAKRAEEEARFAAQRAVEEERKRVEAETQKRIAEEKRLAEIAEAKCRNEDHQKKISTEAAESIVASVDGVSLVLAMSIVRKIRQGEIKHLEIRF